MAVPRRLILSAGMAGVSLALISACDKKRGPAQAFRAIDITGATYALDFELPDTEGQIRRLADFKDKIVVVFFGFTQCPDVCPATMLELAAVKKALGADGDRVQGIFVTVDPERDTPDVLRAYVQNFGSDFIALRGDLEQTKAVAKHFKVFFAKVPGQSPGSYTMDHTAGSYVFDTRGKIRLFTRYGTGQEALLHDLKQLLA